MKTKKELKVLCEAFFIKADPSVYFVKKIVSDIIDKYHGSLEKEYVVEVTEDVYDVLYDNNEYLSYTAGIVSDILSVSITSISISPNKILEIFIKV